LLAPARHAFQAGGRRWFSSGSDAAAAICVVPREILQPFPDALARGALFRFYRRGCQAVALLSRRTCGF
jgi:hypothetical protein